MLPSFKNRHAALLSSVCVVLLSLLLGFYFSRNGLTVMEDVKRYEFSLWLLHKYGLYPTEPRLVDIIKVYAPLWDLILGLSTQFIFSFLQDPYWVRHALTLALFPIGLYYTYRVLLRASVQKSTALLAVSMLYGLIRFGGYSIQTKDFPAAMAFTWVSVYLWVRLQEMQKSKMALFSFGTIALLTFVSLVPYLLRVPILLHFVLLEGLAILLALHAHNEPLWKRIATALLPIVLATLIHYALFPTYWGTVPWHGWINNLKIFSAHPVYFAQRFYGNIYPSYALPWWYAFGWIPMMMHPVTLGLFLVGIGRIIFLKHKRSETVMVPLLRKTMHCSILEWLIVISLLSWAAILVIQPTLYNGFRQILFLYPQLLVIAALGMDRLRERWKLVLSGILICVSTFSYWQWKRYSYLYIPAFFPYTDTSYFSGEDRHVCIPKAVDFLVKSVPANSNIYFFYTRDIHQHYQRYGTSILLKDIAKKPLNFANKLPKNKPRPYYVIFHNQYIDKMQAIEEIVPSSKREIVWEDLLPSGERACIVVYYPNIVSP